MALVLALAGLAILLAAPLAAQTVVSIDRDIATDTVWPSVAGIYLVTRPIAVAEGASLAIAPGVVVKFELGAGLTVHGTLTAVGTAESPIVFTSVRDDNVAGDLPADGPTVPSPGDWGELAFVGPGSDGSQLAHCEVWFGGGGSGALVHCDGAAPQLSASLLSAGTYGLLCENSAAPRIQATRIDGCLSVPVALSPDSDPDFDAVVFGAERDNGYDGIGLLESTLTDDAYLPRRDTRIGAASVENITYVLLGRITVERTAVLRLQAGLVLKAVDSQAGFEVHGGLEAHGTADSMTVFTSVRDDACGRPYDTNRDESRSAPAIGDWFGIAFEDSSAGGLAWCRVRFGGESALVAGGQDVDLSVAHCVLADGVRGVSVGQGAHLSFADNEVRACREVPLEITPATVLTQAGNSFLANGLTAIGLRDEPLTRPGRLRALDIGGHAGLAYYLNGLLSVEAPLVVDPGVVIKFAPGATGMAVHASLAAAGELQAPIVFTSVHDDCHGAPLDAAGNGWDPGPCPGDWGGLDFGASSDLDHSLLEHCIISFGGYEGVGAVSAHGRAPNMRSCTLWWNLVGFQMEYFPAGFAKGLPGEAPAPPWRPGAQIARDVVGNDFAGNVVPVINDLGGVLTQDTILELVEPQLGVPVVNRLAGDLIVPHGVTLTLPAGLSLAVGEGGIVVRGALIAEGFADFHPFGPEDYPPFAWPSVPDTGCVFVPGCDISALDPLGALDKAAGEGWGGIAFENTSDDAVSRVSHLRIRGAETAVTVRNASPALTSLRIENAVIDGIRIEGRSRPAIADCRVTGCGRVALAMSLMADPQLSGNEFLDNGYEGIGVLGETLARDFTLGRRNVAQRENLPYLVLEDLAVGPDVSLTIEAGLALKFLPDTKLSVAHSLIARGGHSPDSLTVFTSIADDFYGGDSNQDSTASGAAAAPWGGVRLLRTAALGKVVFQHCAFRFAGATDGAGALDIAGECSPTVTDCSFTGNVRGVVFREAAGDPETGQLERCAFTDNTEYAVLNLGLAHAVRARDCWWGHPSGPFDGSNDVRWGGWLNLAGLGDPVSDRVDYTPWLTEPGGSDLLGDVSLNGEVTAQDAALVLRSVVGQITLEQRQAQAADVTCEAGVTALDAAWILRFAAHLIGHFPCEADSIATKSESARPLDLAAADAAVFLEPLGDGEGGVRCALAWQGTSPLLAADFALRTEPGWRLSAVVPAPGAAGAQLASRVDALGPTRLALAAAEPLPAGALFELLVTPEDAASAGRPGLPLRIVHARLNERSVIETSDGPDPVLGILLEQNRPNPFNPATVIRFGLAGETGARVRTRVSIHDASGRRVRLLLAEDLVPGVHDLLWDGRDDAGTRVASGVYLCRVEAGEQALSRKMILLK